VPVTDGQAVRYHAHKNAHPEPACCVAEPPEEDHRGIHNDSLQVGSEGSMPAATPHPFGSAAEPAAVNAWPSTGRGWNAADVPTMYHAIGKQRGTAASYGHLTEAVDQVKTAFY
jgi:hypothetical protein